MRGMPCSMHRAVISFLYMGSSQFSARMHSSAWQAHSLKSQLFVISLLKCSPDACQAPWQPHGHRGRDRRRWEPASGPGIFINYTFKYQIIAVSCGFEDMEHYHTSWMAVLMSMGPEAGAAAGASSPSTSDMMSSLMDRQGVNSESNQQAITYC